LGGFGHGKRSWQQCTGTGRASGSWPHRGWPHAVFRERIGRCVRIVPVGGRLYAGLHVRIGMGTTILRPERRSGRL
jgi:hypothetical protein